MWLIHFKRDGELQIESQFIGPFTSWDAAYDYCVDKLPSCHVATENLPEGGSHDGYKYIREMQSPEE